MFITPGLSFIITRVVPVLLGPPLVLHALLIIIFHSSPNLNLTPGLLLWTYLLSPFIHLYVSTWISRVKVTLAARRLAARVVPRINGSFPGNVDLLIQGMTASKSQYLGEPLLGAFKLANGVRTCSLEILGDDRILTIDPRNIQKVLATEFEKYRKGSMFNSIMAPMLGTGVFNSDGEMWQFHRKMTRPFFSKERVTDLLLYERKTAIALQKMQERLDTGLPVDFQDLVSRFTLDSASEFLLGTSINSLDSTLVFPYNISSSSENSEMINTASTRFASSFAQAQITLLSRMELSYLWPLNEILRDKMKAPMAEIRSFIDPIVRNARIRRESGVAKDEETLLGHLLNVTGDTTMIVDETLNILLAGRDTTASLLTFVTYCLAMYPQILDRLREEILTSVGSTRAPSYDEIRDMKYLRAVLNETLRLYPPVPFNVRETIAETLWHGENGETLYVPPNLRVVYSVFHVHRNEEHWGPDAHIFDPDRWLDSRLRRFTTNPFIFLPFHGGPRICLGQQFAYHETSFFLVRFLQRYDHIELAPESQPPHTCPPASWKDTENLTPLSKRRPLERCFMRSHLTMYADFSGWTLGTRFVSADGGLTSAREF